LNELNLKLKSVLISIITVIPFWYISIFLIDKNIITSYPIYISIAFCFCFSILCLFPNYSTAYSYVKYVHYPKIKKALDETKEILEKGKKKLKEEGIPDEDERTTQLIMLTERYKILIDDYEKNHRIESDENLAGMYALATILTIVIISLFCFLVVCMHKFNIGTLGIYKFASIGILINYLLNIPLGMSITHSKNKQ
jgi:hypothetical protein